METLPDGKILHARMKIGDSILMMSDEFRGNTASHTSLDNNTVTYILKKRRQVMG